MITLQDAYLLRAGDLTRFDIDLSTFGVKKGAVLPVQRVEYWYGVERTEHEPRVFHTFPTGTVLWTSLNDLTLVGGPRTATSLASDVVALFHD